MSQRAFFAHYKPGPVNQRGWVALGADYWNDFLVVFTSEHTAPGPTADQDIRHAWTRLQAMSSGRPPWPQLWAEWKASVLQQAGTQPVGLTLAAVAPGPTPQVWMAAVNSFPLRGWRNEELWSPGASDGMEITSQAGDLWVWGTPNLWNAVQPDEVTNVIQTSSSTEDIATRLVDAGNERFPHAFGALVVYVEE